MKPWPPATLCYGGHGGKLCVRGARLGILSSDIAERQHGYFTDPGQASRTTATSFELHEGSDKYTI